MPSLVTLHLMVLELLNDIKSSQNSNFSKYTDALEQIDRILLTLDIIAHSG